MEPPPCPWGFTFLKLRINLQLWAGEWAGVHSSLWVHPLEKSFFTGTTWHAYLQLIPSLPHSKNVLKSPRWVTPTWSGLSANQTYCNELYHESFPRQGALGLLSLIKKLFRISLLAHFCRSFSHIGIKLMLSLVAHTDDIPTVFSHGFTHKKQELLKFWHRLQRIAPEEDTIMLINWAVGSSMWQGAWYKQWSPWSLNPTGVFWSFPDDSTLTTHPVCMREGCMIAL